MNPQLLFLLVPESRTLFNLDAQTFIGMVPNLFNFALLAAFITHLLYGPVKRILAARAERVEGEMNEAAASKASAAELKTQYEQKVHDIELERASILDEARRQANERRAQILDEAKAEAEDVKNRAARDIAIEKERVKDTVYEAIVNISTDMAARLISVTVDKNAHDRLFAEAMAELEATALRQDTAV